MNTALAISRRPEAHLTRAASPAARGGRVVEQVVSVPMAGRLCRVTLFDAQTIRCLWGLPDLGAVTRMVDTGELFWVFDLSLDVSGSRRCLRAWSREILEGSRHSWSEAEVIDDIIDGAGLREISPYRLAMRWVMSNQHMIRLGEAGHIKMTREGKNFWMPVSSLRSFLISRRVI